MQKNWKKHTPLRYVSDLEKTKQGVITTVYDIGYSEIAKTLQRYILDLSGKEFSYFRYEPYLKTLFESDISLDQIKEAIKEHWVLNQNTGYFKPGVFMKLKNIKRYLNKEVKRSQAQERESIFNEREKKGSYVI